MNQTTLFCYASAALADRTRLKYLSSMTVLLKLITSPSYMPLIHCIGRPLVKSSDAVGTRWVVRGKTAVCQPLNANPKRRIAARGPMNTIPIDYDAILARLAIRILLVATITSISCANPDRAQDAVLTTHQGDAEAERTAHFWPGAIRSRQRACLKLVTLVVDDPNFQLLLLWGGPSVRLPRLGLAGEHDTFGISLYSTLSNNHPGFRQCPIPAGRVHCFSPTDLPLLSQKQCS